MAITSEKIRIKLGRLSFPKLFRPVAFQEGQDPRFESTFLLDPSDKVHAKLIKEIKAKAKAVLEEKFNGKVPKGVKYCFGDGNDKDYDGYEDMFYISTANKLRPTVVDRDRTPLTEEDGKPYAGSFVNATITLWPQDHPKGGKRVNANLLAVQFAKDGEAFGQKPVDAEDEFDVMEDDDDDSEDDFLGDDD